MAGFNHKKTRIKLLIAYKGTHYRGWQNQRNDPTIQETLENAVKKIFRDNIPLTAAGRTDAGAHALGQIAHCDIPSSVNLARISLLKGLNSYLPEGIHILRVWKAPDHFHALHSALRKQYIYLLSNKAIPNVFLSSLVYWYPHSIQWEKLQAMSQIIQGQHDFKSLQNSGTSVKNTVRTVFSAQWIFLKKHILCFKIVGDGFLKQLVRNLVGTQLTLMNQDQSVQKLKTILANTNRSAAFKTVPASGLYLHKVYYPSDLDRQCKKI